MSHSAKRGWRIKREVREVRAVATDGILKGTNFYGGFKDW